MFGEFLSLVLFVEEIAIPRGFWVYYMSWGAIFNGSWTKVALSIGKHFRDWSAVVPISSAHNLDWAYQ